MFTSLVVVAVALPAALAAPSTPLKTRKVVALRGGGIGGAPLAASSKLLGFQGGAMGGAELSNTLAGLLVATGLQGWYAPRSTMEMYGPTNMSDEEVFFLRTLQGLNVVQGLTMLAAAQNDFAKAAIVCLFGQAMSNTANLPMLEHMGVKTGPIVGCIALFGALGEAARRGLLAAEVVANVNTFMLLGLSVFEILKPARVVEQLLGKGKASSELSKSLMQNACWTKVNMGLFLLVGKKTGSVGMGLAAAAGSNALNVLATTLRAGKIGVKKGGLIFWGVVSGAIALAALKKEG